MPLYSSHYSRPNTPVNLLVGFEALKAGYGYSDEELYDQYLHNLWDILSPTDRDKKLDSLSVLKLKTARAYRLKLVFQQAFSFDGRPGVYALKKWYAWAIRSRLEPIKKFARLLKEHWNGVARWFESKLTNGLLEGLNSLVQAAKARARLYRSTANFKIMVYMKFQDHGLHDCR